MKYFKKLVGEKVYLAPYNKEDAEIYANWLNDFKITDYLGNSNKIVTLESEEKYLEEQIEAEATFAIVELKEDKLIGSISLNNINHFKRKATLGIFIGDTDFRGIGYGTEAIQLILDYGFNYLNLNNINLDVIEFNERAINCYKKCGFTEMGRRRKCEFINGKYYDTIQMDILAEEFNGEFIKNKNI